MSYLNHIHHLQLQSRCFQQSYLQTCSDRVVTVLLPSSYTESKSYPCVFFLAGYGGNGVSMLGERGSVQMSFADELLKIQSELDFPFISVFIDGSTPMGGSQYINSNASGNMMDHVCDEVVPFIDQTFSTKKNYRARTLTGHSSGGYASIVIPMLRPGVFGNAIVSACDSYFEMSQFPMWASAAVTIGKAGGVDRFIRKFRERALLQKQSSSEFQTYMLLAMASCYSPCANKNLAHADLPFELEKLTPNPDIQNLWLSHDPIHLIDQKAQTLQKLHHLHLDCGSHDEFCAQFGHRIFAHKLDKHSIHYQATEFDGGHFKTSFRYAFRFQLLKKSMTSV